MFSPLFGLLSNFSFAHTGYSNPYKLSLFFFVADGLWDNLEAAHIGLEHHGVYRYDSSVTLEGCEFSIPVFSVWDPWRQWPSRRQQKIIFYACSFLKIHLHHSFKIKSQSSHKTVQIKVFFVFCLVDGRIRIRTNKLWIRMHFFFLSHCIRAFVVSISSRIHH